MSAPEENQVFLSNKGGKKVIFHNGYQYRYDKVYGGKEYFMCNE